LTNSRASHSIVSGIDGHAAPVKKSFLTEGTMKRTEALSVLGDFSFDEKAINIHPNDGFELGLMTTDHVVRIYTGCSFAEFTSDSAPAVHGKIYLKNECRQGTVEISLKTVEKMKKPRKVLLILDQDRLYIQPV
jgi:hypothetical protein